MPQIAASLRLFALSMLSLAMLSAGCFAAADKARLEAVQEKLERTTQGLNETNHTLSTLIVELENEKRLAAREKYCKEPKIIEFMDQVQAGLQSACTPIAMVTTLNFLDKIPTACAHLDPKAGMNSLLRTRIGQIRKNLEPESLHASTRILVMAKPAEDTEASRSFALDMANRVVEDIVKKALPHRPSAPAAKEGAPKPREIPILGPFLLPCELAHNMGLLYKKPYYRPIEGEPKLGKPDVVIFVVVSPC